MDAEARARELLDTYDQDCGRGSMYPPRHQLEAGIAAALREVERETVERCAKVADTAAEQPWGLQTEVMARGIAALIRALGDERRAAD